MSDEQRLSDDDRAEFDVLLLELANLFEQEGRVGGDMAADGLRSACGEPFAGGASGAPDGLLRRVSELPGALPITSLVAKLGHRFAWTNWSGEGLADDVSDRLFTTELVGPDGHIKADSVRVGLLTSEAFTDYPVSSHSGEETYAVLAGTAEWIVGDGGYVAMPPGSLVHHPAWMLHGRRTLSEPFLGAWRWSGDLDLTSFRVEN